ncbi:hypothetical protein [Streptomyces sp. NPDC102437]|uniref:hypothetical protein n=1 Tax=Streptomyces sp. NPDC102437 TaxID=3366175 RepID=UPI003817AFAF
MTGRRSERRTGALYAAKPMLAAADATAPARGPAVAREGLAGRRSPKRSAAQNQ